MTVKTSAKIGVKEEIVQDLKKSMGELMEELAISFFKARGEM